jgi:hypothetical protein
MATAPVPGAATRQKPNAAVWRLVPKFTLAEAACLLADVVPSVGISNDDAYALFQTLVGEIQSKQVTYIPTGLEYVSAPGGILQPVEQTQISREELQRFAERHDIRPRPRFLFPD